MGELNAFKLDLTNAVLSGKWFCDLTACCGCKLPANTFEGMTATVGWSGMKMQTSVDDTVAFENMHHFTVPSSVYNWIGN